MFERHRIYNLNLQFSNMYPIQYIGLDMKKIANPHPSRVIRTAWFYKPENPNAKEKIYALLEDESYTEGNTPISEKDLDIVDVRGCTIKEFISRTSYSQYNLIYHGDERKIDEETINLVPDIARVTGNGSTIHFSIYDKQSIQIMEDLTVDFLSNCSNDDRVRILMRAINRKEKKLNG